MFPGAVSLPAGTVFVFLLWYAVCTWPHDMLASMQALLTCVVSQRRLPRTSDIVKESPSLLATRNWTPFAHTRLRRYNEVSHYLRRRLNRAYKPATEYINTFSSHLLANFAEYVALLSCGGWLQSSTFGISSMIETDKRLLDRFLILIMGGVILTLSALLLVWDEDFAFADLTPGRSTGWWLAVLLALARLVRGFLPKEVGWRRGCLWGGG